MAQNPGKAVHDWDSTNVVMLHMKSRAFLGKAQIVGSKGSDVFCGFCDMMSFGKTSSAFKEFF